MVVTEEEEKGKGGRMVEQGQGVMGQIKGAVSSLVGGKVIPRLVVSCSFQAAPIPKYARPPESTSSVETAFITIAG